MRVLFWSPTFWPHIGGAEVLGTELVAELIARGHEVLVVARRDTADIPPEDHHRGIRIVRYPMIQPLQSNDIEAVVGVRRAVAEVKRDFAPDVVHIYLFGPDLWFHRQTATSFPAPEVVTLHQQWGEEYERPGSLYGETVRRAAAVVACSKGTMDLFDQGLGLGGRGRVVLNSLPPATARPAPFPEHPVVLCLGRLEDQKGFDLALDAFARLIDTHPDVRLVVAGDGAARLELEAQAQSLGLGERVEFLGWVAPGAVADVINGATVVAMPSRWEPFGLVALQAAQMGRPVVAARVEGLPEVVVDGVTGLLHEPLDVADLAAKLDAVLSDSALAMTLGEAASRRASDEAGFGRHVDSYEAIYREVVAATA